MPPNAGRPGFTPRYRELMQLDPAVVLAHARIREELRGLPERAAEGEIAEMLHERHRWAERRKFRRDVVATGAPSAEVREVRDAVERASMDSFPASDPPGWILSDPR